MKMSIKWEVVKSCRVGNLIIILLNLGQNGHLYSILVYISCDL